MCLLGWDGAVIIVVFCMREEVVVGRLVFVGRLLFVWMWVSLVVARPYNCIEVGLEVRFIVCGRGVGIVAVLVVSVVLEGCGVCYPIGWW